MKGKKDCFGVLDRVFPLGDHGMREVVPECLGCNEKTACLRAALETKDGLVLRENLIDRHPAHGVWDRVKRWSQRKELSRRLAAQERAGK